MAPAVSAQNPPTGLSLVIFEPMVCTMRHPPKYVPRAMARIGGEDDRPVIAAPSVMELVGIDEAGGVESTGDDAHGLLRIVAAVAEAVGGGGEKLRLTEGSVDSWLGSCDGRSTRRRPSWRARERVP